jgi:hypothetical protein
MQTEYKTTLLCGKEIKMTAQELQNKVCQTEKENKYKDMVKIQMRFIKEEMERGGHSVIWIFSDMEYYTNNLQKTWFDEFAMRAKSAFESKGFHVFGVAIRW